MWFVYILKCSDSTYYVGYTQDLNERIIRHEKGENTYTKSRKPFTLAFYASFFDKYKAIEFEKYLKSGSGRAFARKRFL